MQVMLLCGQVPLYGNSLLWAKTRAGAWMKQEVPRYCHLEVLDGHANSADQQDDPRKSQEQPEYKHWGRIIWQAHTQDHDNPSSN